MILDLTGTYTLSSTDNTEFSAIGISGEGETLEFTINKFVEALLTSDKVYEDSKTLEIDYRHHTREIEIEFGKNLTTKKKIEVSAFSMYDFLKNVDKYAADCFKVIMSTYSVLV